MACYSQRIPGYLPDRLSDLVNVKRMPAAAGAPIFTTHQPMASYPELMASYQPHYSQHNMSAREFFQRAASNSNDDGAVSFASRLDSWPELLEDVAPTEPLVADPENSMSQTFTWIGQKDTLTPCHHDHYHNFYALLEGSKEFLLLPPSVHRLLYLHPSLHPAHRSSQVFVKRCSESFPKAHDLPAMQVTLQAGEVLYVPALWFHHVSTLNFSIAVNVWSISESEDIYSQILELPLPMPAEGEPHAIQGLRGYLLLLLQGLRAGAGVRNEEESHCSDGDVESCTDINNPVLWASDWDSVPSNGTEAAAKAFIRSYLLESRYLRIPHSTPRYCESATDMALLLQDRFLVHAIGGVLSRAEMLFGQILQTRGRDVMLLYLANYIEHAVHVTVGVQQVAQFLSDLVLC